MHPPGARVLGMPWARARRRQLVASRVDTPVAVVSLMRRLHKAPRVLVSASAVGLYGFVHPQLGGALADLAQAEVARPATALQNVGQKRL